MQKKNPKKPKGIKAGMGMYLRVFCGYICFLRERAEGQIQLLFFSLSFHTFMSFSEEEALFQNCNTNNNFTHFTQSFTQSFLLFLLANLLLNSFIHSLLSLT